MDKIAIHVLTGCEELSEAVQKRLFKTGYGWSNGINKKVLYTGQPYICLNKKSLTWCSNTKGDLLDVHYTILTVDEFFKREKEKEETVTLAKYTVKRQLVGVRIERISDQFAIYLTLIR